MKGHSCAGALGALVCAALAACSVGPAYRRPEIAPPAEWQSAPPAAPSVWPESEWWHGFGSQQLDALIAEAERGNDDLAAAMARIEEADAQAKIAGAPLLPAVGLNAQASRQRAPVSGLGPELSNLFYPQVTASYELDFWGKNRALRAAARAAAVASRYDRETVALTVVSSVASTYFQALQYRDRIEVAQRNLANGRKILRGLKLEQSAGTATSLDVAQQQTTVALLDAAIPPLELAMRQTLYSLAILIGRTPESIELEGGTLHDLKSPAVVAGLPSRLLTRRPDVAEAEQQLIAANANIVAARAALFPNIELTAGGGFESGSLTSLISPVNRVYEIGAGLTQPIFEGGALRGQVLYTKARYTELLHDYHKTVLTAFDNVESALVASRQTADELERQRGAVAQARHSFDLAQAQMSAGVVNVLTVLNTENALFGAEDTLVQVDFAHLMSLVDLFTALGGGWHQS